MNASQWTLFAAIAVYAAAPCCVAQTAESGYPAKPVRMVIPFAAGGVIDIVGRLVGTALSEHLGQPFTASNRAGAGNVEGVQLVAKVPADGYTLLLTSASNAYNTLAPKPPQDTFKGLAAVSLIGVTPGMLVVHPSVPANNLKKP